MKTKLTLLAIVTFVAVASSSNAQTSPEERVKILPTNLPETIKLHYAMKVQEPLEVTFFDLHQKVLGKDQINHGQFPNGVSKRYDVSNINKQDFWVQIRSSENVITYHVIPSKDKKYFTAILETAADQLMVKAE